MARKKQRGSYPYPVLDHTPEVLADFSLSGNPVITPSTATVEIDLEIVLTESIRTAFVIDGTFSIIAEWECSATLQSGLITIGTERSSGDTILARLSIPLNQLADQVSVSIAMVSETNMDGFRWPNQSDDYGDATFSLMKGDRVGFAGSFSFNASRWFDPMVPPIESCIEFVQDLRNRDGFTVDLADDVIKVMLPVQIFRGFGLQANQPLIQQTVVLVPALMHALAEMQSNPDNHVDRGWFRSLDQIISARKLQGLSPLETVQELLDHPAKALLLEDMQSEEEIDVNQ